MKSIFMFCGLLHFACFGALKAGIDQICFRGIYLRSVIYHDQSDWIVTLDGKHYTPQKPSSGPIVILNVGRHSVRFLYSGTELSLKPGSSYDVYRKRVINGRCQPQKAPRKVTR